MIDRNFCQFHGGRTGRRGARIDNLPTFYAKHLKTSLKKTIEDQLEVDPIEQINIFEELAIIRATAVSAVTLYEKCVGTKAEQGAGALVRDVLKEVVTTCQAAQQIESSSKDNISIHSIGHIVNQIVKVAYDVFGDDFEKAQLFEKLVNERVKMPLQQSGTLITPDQDAAEMDETVPSE